MRSVVLLLALAASTAAITCSVAERFACTTDPQCVTEVASGRCEPEGVCSFPDGGCDSGHRFGELAGELSGDCVGGDASTTSTGETLDLDESSSDDPPGTTSTSTTTTTTTTTATSSTSDPDPDTDTSGTPANPYGPCPDPDLCGSAGAQCIMSDNGSNVCAPPCDERPCPSGDPFMSVPLCTEYEPGVRVCVLLCKSDEFCPSGMACETEALMSMGVGYCAWPPSN